MHARCVRHCVFTALFVGCFFVLAPPSQSPSGTQYSKQARPFVTSALILVFFCGPQLLSSFLAQILLLPCCATPPRTTPHHPPPFLSLSADACGFLFFVASPPPCFSSTCDLHCSRLTEHPAIVSVYEHRCVQSRCAEEARRDADQGEGCGEKATRRRDAEKVTCFGAVKTHADSLSRERGSRESREADGAHLHHARHHETMRIFLYKKTMILVDSGSMCIDKRESVCRSFESAEGKVQRKANFSGAPVRRSARQRYSTWCNGAPAPSLAVSPASLFLFVSVMLHHLPFDYAPRFLFSFSVPSR